MTSATNLFLSNLGKSDPNTTGLWLEGIYKDIQKCIKQGSTLHAIQDKLVTWCVKDVYL